jgi:hypothetical protein
MPLKRLPSPEFKARVLELVRIAEITAPRLVPMRKIGRPPQPPDECRNGHEGEMVRRSDGKRWTWRCRVRHREEQQRRRDGTPKRKYERAHR